MTVLTLIPRTAAAVVAVWIAAARCVLSTSASGIATQRATPIGGTKDSPRQNSYSADNNRNQTKTPTSARGAFSSENESEFPGIYTVRLDSNANVPELEPRWMHELDVLRVECSGGGDARRSCLGHVLVRSRDEHERLLKQQRQPSSSSSSSSPLDTPGAPGSTLGVLYNSSLTERWVRPKLKVAEANTAELSRGRRSIRRELPSAEQDRIGKLEGSNRGFDDSKQDQYSTIRYFDCYFDYEGTLSWIDDFVKSYGSSDVLEIEWKTIGSSWKRTKAQELNGERDADGEDNGYDIQVLTITGRSLPIPGDDITKAPLLLVSSTHAREYTPPELVRRWLQNLINRVEARDPDALSMLEHTKIHWVPYLNPDGRVLAETTQPLRRKNLNDEWTGDSRESLLCSKDSFGVDLNRNFPFEWGNDKGSDTIPCSSYSRGSGASSEPETQALVEYAESIFPEQQQSQNAILAGGGDYRVVHDQGHSVDGSSTKWKGYDPQTTRGVFVDVHSFGKVYIYPWGNINAISPNDSGLRSVLGHLTSLTGLSPSGPGPFHYGVASGATDDWAYGVLGACSMTWELGTEFHEPCGDFESTHSKHFAAMDYLARIAPFPFALGEGPIVSEIGDLSSTVVNVYLDDSDHDASNSTAVRVWTQTSTETGDKDDVSDSFGEGVLTLKLRVELPKRVPEYFDPIEFEYDDDDDQNDGDDSSVSSLVSAILVFYGNHPLVGATTAGAPASDKYWELVFDPVPDESSWYQGDLSGDQLWEAFLTPEFAEATAATITTPRRLYVQAMDNAGNWGPVAATSLNFVVVQEKDDDGLLRESTLYPISSTIAPTHLSETTSNTTSKSNAHRDASKIVSDGFLREEEETQEDEISILPSGAFGGRNTHVCVILLVLPTIASLCFC